MMLEISGATVHVVGLVLLLLAAELNASELQAHNQRSSFADALVLFIQVLQLAMLAWLGAETVISAME